MFKKIIKPLFFILPVVATLGKFLWLYESPEPDALKK